MAAVYKVGLGKEEISEKVLKRCGLKWEKVNPREIIISLAPQLVGKPYKFGASVSRDAPEAFDCSSFTAYVYVQGGIAIPRMCDEQYRFGKTVSEAEAKPGDLVFFKSNRTDIPPNAVGHNGVYIGNQEMIHAGGVNMGYGKVVREKVTASKYYQTGFLGYRRLIPDEGERHVVEIPEDRQDIRNADALLQELKKYS